MSDLFTRLAAQALGIAPGIRPLVAPMFAPGSPLANEMPIDLMGQASWSDFNPPSTAKSVPNAGAETDQHQPSLEPKSGQRSPLTSPTVPLDTQSASPPLSSTAPTASTPESSLNAPNQVRAAQSISTVTGTPSLAPQSKSPTHPVIQRQVDSAINLEATPVNLPATQPPSPHPATTQRTDLSLPNHYPFQHQPFETTATHQLNEVASTQPRQTLKPAPSDLQINQTIQQYGIVEDPATQAQVWEPNHPNELQSARPADQPNLPAGSTTHPVIQRQVDSALDLAATPVNLPATQPPSHHPATTQRTDLSLPNHYPLQHQPFETTATHQQNEVASTQPGQTLKPAPSDLQINQTIQQYGIVEDPATQAQVWKPNHPNELQSARPADQPNLPAGSPISSSQLDTHNHAIKSPTVSHQNPTFNPQTSASRNQQTAFSYQEHPLASAVSDQHAAFSPFNPAFKLQNHEPTVPHSPSFGKKETALPSPLTVQSFPSPTAESEVQSTQSHPENASVPRSPSAQLAQVNPLQTPQVRLADSQNPIQQNRLRDEVSKVMLTRSVSGEAANTTTIEQRRTIQATFIPQSLQDGMPNPEFHPQRESEKTIKPISSHFFRESAIGTVAEQREMLQSPSSRSPSKTDAVNRTHLPHYEGEIAATQTEKIASVPPASKAEPETRKNAHTSDDSLTSLLPDRPTQTESLTQDARWLQHLTRDRPAAQPPSIRVSIGRITIAASTPAPIIPQFRRPRPSLSLDQYLSQRQEGQ